jgi:hypothetical protein
MTPLNRDAPAIPLATECDDHTQGRPAEVV